MLVLSFLAVVFTVNTTTVGDPIPKKVPVSLNKTVMLQLVNEARKKARTAAIPITTPHRRYSGMRNWKRLPTAIAPTCTRKATSAIRRRMAAVPAHALSAKGMPGKPMAKTSAPVTKPKKPWWKAGCKARHTAKTS